jgi:phenylpropionate dioxygenase-like ring-hydroxylating dioxygenase large terminal subunit
MSTTPDVLRFFHPVMPARELGSTPVRRQIDGRFFVFFRDHVGRPGALDDRCPHRGAPLSAGRVRPDGRLACAYHGWHFSTDGAGVSPSSPKLKCSVSSWQVHERHDYLWIAAHDARADSMPLLEEQGYGFAGAVTCVFEAPLEIVLDNFSENEHFPFVHWQAGWDEGGIPAVDFSWDKRPDGGTIRYRGPQRASMGRSLMSVRAGDWFVNESVTRFDPVHAVFYSHWEDPHSHARRALSAKSAVFLVPETSHRTRVHVFLWFKLEGWLRALAPIVHFGARKLTRREVEADSRMLARMPAEVAFGRLEGMRLGIYDAPLIHFRKLLHAVYRQRAEPTVARLSARDGATEPASATR